MELNDEKEMISNIKMIIEKFVKTGFDSLTSEDLAVAITNINFDKIFKKETGLDWRN